MSDRPATLLTRMSPLTRAVLLWSVIGALLLGALGSAIGALGQNVYSPSGFVGAYLNALARHDVHAALAMPGAAMTKAQLRASGITKTVSRELLRADVLTSLHDVTTLHDDELAGGRHRVTVGYTLDGEPGSSSYVVEPDGRVLGIFASWRFASSPLAVARVSVKHAATFTIAGHTVDTRATSGVTDAFDNTADYLVFAPSRLRLGHDSHWLSAKTGNAAVTAAGTLTSVTVTARPTEAFEKAVAKQLDGYLDDCVAQEVLQPAGCPMGAEIDNRVQSPPKWRMVTYPKVLIRAGDDGWYMPTTNAVAHLTVDVQSLFDGSVSTRDDDEPFPISLTAIDIRPDGSLDLTVGN